MGLVLVDYEELGKIISRLVSGDVYGMWAGAWNGLPMED